MQIQSIKYTYVYMYMYNTIQVYTIKGFSIGSNGLRNIFLGQK